MFTTMRLVALAAALPLLFTASSDATPSPRSIPRPRSPAVEEDMNCMWLTECGPPAGPVEKREVIFCASGFGNCIVPTATQDTCTMSGAAAAGFEGYPQKACTFAPANGRVFNFIIAEDAQTLPTNQTVGTGWDWRQFYMIQKDSPDHYLYTEPNGNRCVSKYYATTSAIYDGGGGSKVYGV